MDIVAMSMAMAEFDVKSQVSVALADKVMSDSKDIGNNVVHMMEQSVQPDIGSNLDIKI